MKKTRVSRYPSENYGKENGNDENVVKGITGSGSKV